MEYRPVVMSKNCHNIVNLFHFMKYAPVYDYTLSTLSLFCCTFVNILPYPVLPVLSLSIGDKPYGFSF